MVQQMERVKRGVQLDENSLTQDVTFVVSLTPEVKIAGLSLSNMLSSSSFVVFLPAKRANTHTHKHL